MGLSVRRERQRRRHDPEACSPERRSSPARRRNSGWNARRVSRPRRIHEAWPICCKPLSASRDTPSSPGSMPDVDVQQPRVRLAPRRARRALRRAERVEGDGRGLCGRCDGSRGGGGGGRAAGSCEPMLDPGLRSRTRGPRWRCLPPSSTGIPSRSMSVVGITGTNGKTTTAYLLRSVFEAAGKKCGLLGTVSYSVGDEELPAARTTPEAPDVQRMFRRMVDSGCAACVMEVSSHALVAAAGRRNALCGGRLHESDEGSSRLSRRHGVVLLGEEAAVRDARRLAHRR